MFKPLKPVCIRVVTGRYSLCLCPYSHDGQRPRSPAAANDHHGCLCLQTFVPAVKGADKDP